MEIKRDEQGELPQLPNLDTIVLGRSGIDTNDKQIVALIGQKMQKERELKLILEGLARHDLSIPNANLKALDLYDEINSLGAQIEIFTIANREKTKVHEVLAPNGDLLDTAGLA